MPKNTDNPYDNPYIFAPFGNSGVGPQNPDAGATSTMTGGSFGEQKDYYGLVGQRNGLVTYGQTNTIRTGNAQTANFYRGVVQDETAFQGGILTPQTYMRPTVPPSQESRTVAGPVAAMVFRPEGSA